MGILELREKWKKSISKVDDKFLLLVDTLYETYSKNSEDDFLMNCQEKYKIYLN